MPLMKWDSSQFSVRVQKFDGDHKHLFTMVNDLYDAMQGGKGKAVLHQVLLGLVGYTQQHFAAEEVAMQRTGFPGMPAHVDEHRKLTAKVQAFLHEFEAGNALISIDLLMFLRDWLEKHIKVTDKQYAAHLVASGMN
jgi:hemerythrin